MRGYPREALMFRPFPEGGGYPKGFVEWALSETLNEDNPDAVLHVCSGSMIRGTTVDIRESVNPDFVADGRNLPFEDGSFRTIMIDPPYGETYAEHLYGTGRHYPKPGALLAEASRVVRVGGRVGILHFLVPQVANGKVEPGRMRLVGVWGVTTGMNNAIRAWTVFEKRTVPDPRTYR